MLEVGVTVGVNVGVGVEVGTKVGVMLGVTCVGVTEITGAFKLAGITHATRATKTASRTSENLFILPTIPDFFLHVKARIKSPPYPLRIPRSFCSRIPS